MSQEFVPGHASPPSLKGLLTQKPFRVRKRVRIRNRYNLAPNLTQDTNGKLTTSQLDNTNES